MFDSNGTHQFTMSLVTGDYKYNFSYRFVCVRVYGLRKRSSCIDFLKASQLGTAGGALQCKSYSSTFKAQSTLLLGHNKHAQNRRDSFTKASKNNMCFAP